MSETMKVVKVDPLEMDPKLLWEITGILHIKMQDFVLYVDDSENVLYLNKTKNIPQEDIDKFVWIVENAGEFYLDDDSAEGQFFNYVFEVYGSKATSTLLNICIERSEKKKKLLAESMAKDISPIIKEELENTSVNDALLYYIEKAGDETGRKTFYNMTGYSSVYCFMLGYLVGAGKIDPENIVSEDDADEDE